MFKTEPNDDRITQMDPVQKIWMFNNWIADQNENAELGKNIAYLIGSFTNPEAVKKLLGEGSQEHQSTDAEFDESTEMLGKTIIDIDGNIKEIKPEVSKPIQRKRRIKV